MKSSLFVPHNWEDKNPDDSHTNQQDTTKEDTIGIPTNEDFDFDELLEKVETSASDNTLNTASLISENDESGEGLNEEEEIKAAAYAEGVIEGRNAEKMEQREELNRASLRINELALVIEKKGIELTTDLESAILNFIRKTTHDIFDDAISENAASLIEKKATEFIKSNELFDFEVYVEVSEHDATLINALGTCPFTCTPNPSLSVGQAKLLAKPKQGEIVGDLQAEFDVRDIIDQKVSGISHA